MRAKTKQTTKVLKCPVCGRRVAKNHDNYCQISEQYIHTKCWFKVRDEQKVVDDANRMESPQ